MARLDLSCNADRDRILMLEKIKLGSFALKFKLWSDPAIVNDHQWLEKGTRWVNLMGVPLFLWSFLTFAGVYKSFSKLKEVCDTMDSSSSIVVVHIKLAECKLAKVPQLVPLPHDGIYYPIKLVLNLQNINFHSFQPLEGKLDLGLVA